MRVKKISASLLVALSLCNFINVSAMKLPNGQDVEWLVSEESVSEDGKAWLKTVDGQTWLASPDGQSWLKTIYGCMWLKSDESMSWFESTFGIEWLGSPDGKAWVKTSSGTEWLEKNRGYICAHPGLSIALFGALTALVGAMEIYASDPTYSFSRACTIM